jgi:hypothetical protein
MTGFAIARNPYYATLHTGYIFIVPTRRARLIHMCWRPVIPVRDAGIQAMDGNLTVAQVLHLDMKYAKVCHPWTLDFDIHAEMTVFRHLCITMRAPAWGCGLCFSASQVKASLALKARKGTLCVASRALMVRTAYPAKLFNSPRKHQERLYCATRRLNLKAIPKAHIQRTAFTAFPVTFHPTTH